MSNIHDFWIELSKKTVQFYGEMKDVDNLDQLRDVTGKYASKLHTTIRKMPSLGDETFEGELQRLFTLLSKYLQELHNLLGPRGLRFWRRAPSFKLIKDKTGLYFNLCRTHVWIEHADDSIIYKFWVQITKSMYRASKTNNLKEFVQEFSKTSAELEHLYKQIKKEMSAQ